MNGDSKEYRKFVIENRDIIESILKDSDSVQRNPKSSINEVPFKMLNNSEVQKHLMSSCFEMIRFIEALISVSPMPPEARKVIKNFQNSRDEAMRNFLEEGSEPKHSPKITETHAKIVNVSPKQKNKKTNKHKV